MVWSLVTCYMYKNTEAVLINMSISLVTIAFGHSLHRLSSPRNMEHGWNDPPMLLHGINLGSPPVNQGQSLPKRTLLNKHVAHPGIFSSGGHVCPKSVVPGSSILSGGTALECGPINGVILLPPASSTEIPKFTAPIIVPTISPKETSPLARGMAISNPASNQPVYVDMTGSDIPVPDFDSDEQMYHFVLSRLRKTCLSCAESVQQRVIHDINQRVDIFSNMWKDGKISYPVKSSMARLATALHHRKCDVAHQIHLALMMDYVSEVSQWMVGIKRLIQEARATEAPLSPTDNTIPNPFSNTAKEAEDSDMQCPTSEISSKDMETGEPEQLTDSTTLDGRDKQQSTEQSDSPAVIEATMIE